MSGFQQAWQGIKQRLSAMSVNQRLILGMVATAVLISATLFGLWIGREEMAVLFSDLTVEDANQALQELSRRNLRADLAHNGTTILVPASHVHRLRIELAAAGIGSSGIVGFEIFDQSGYGMTERQYDVNYQRALQGELTRTIEALQGVQSARVHLVIPKQSIFRNLAAPPTASVLLTLNRQRPVSPEEVLGIQNLVAYSVESLVADNVTILDQHGRTLSANYSDSALGASNRQLELKKEIEQYLADKAQTMLSGVLGPNRSHVRVNATLNFEQIESQRTVFGQEPVVRSEERNESSDPQTGSATESSLTNYEVDQTIERIVGQVGGVTQLSVAVTVDGTYDVPEGGGPQVYKPLSNEQMQDIRRMVQSALGIDTSRGDQLEVVNIQFRGDALEPRSLDGVPFGWIVFFSRHGGQVLLAIMLVVLVMAFRRNLAGALGELAAGRSGATEAARAADGRPDQQEERFDGLPPMTDQMLEDVREYASENPGRVAEVVQSWIHEPEKTGSR